MIHNNKCTPKKITSTLSKKLKVEETQKLKKEYSIYAFYDIMEKKYIVRINDPNYYYHSIIQNPVTLSLPQIVCSLKPQLSSIKNVNGIFSDINNILNKYNFTDVQKVYFYKYMKDNFKVVKLTKRTEVDISNKFDLEDLKNVLFV